MQNQKENDGRSVDSVVWTLGNIKAQEVLMQCFGAANYAVLDVKTTSELTICAGATCTLSTFSLIR